MLGVAIKGGHLGLSREFQADYVSAAPAQHFLPQLFPTTFQPQYTCLYKNVDLKLENIFVLIHVNPIAVWGW
jgi:hypothetical protein